MVDSEIPNSVVSSPQPTSEIPNSVVSSPRPTSVGNPRPTISIPRPAIRVSSEFDSDTSIFVHKVSCKLLDSLAKLKLSFQNDKNGEISVPQLGFVTKFFSVFYDPEEQNAFVKGSCDLGNTLQFSAAHDVKGQQGEVAMVASLFDPSYKLELSSAVPSIGLPKATVKFPLGEVSLEEKEEDEVTRVLSVSGIVKGQLLNGICTGQYKDGDLNLRYSYKDEEMSFIPSISLPSNALSFAFKRRFGPSDKLSYWYNFVSSDWSTVYKHTVSKDLKFKAGYDSTVRLGWASLWVGDENGKAKTAPMKMKVQVMLQVPQDNIEASAIMFRVKKRWDV